MQLLKELFDQQARSLSCFFSDLDLEQAQIFFDRCLTCKGLLIFTGVGKSAIIAEKIALTLISSGTRALFLPAIHFLHGDLGIVSSEDQVIMLSKSGETEELLNLLPFVRQKKASILAMVSSPHSRLAREADCTIYLPVKQELCPFDLVPTISTEVQLLFGDLLAIFLMRAKGMTLNHYALNHPSGSIGKKATLKVADLMLRGAALPKCPGKALLKEVMQELSDKKCGCLIITDDSQKVEGIFTDGDLRRALQRNGAAALEQSIETLMTRYPLCTDKELLAWEAIKMMQKDPKKWVMMMPVVEKEKLIGLIRMHDIIQVGL